MARLVGREQPAAMQVRAWQWMQQMNARAIEFPSLVLTDKANRAAWKHIVENSKAHKQNEKIAARFLPDSAIDDLHDWLDDSDDDRPGDPYYAVTKP